MKRTSRANNRTCGSAAAFAGTVGRREYVFRSGSFKAFCALFNRRADSWLENRSFDSRAFVRAEREAHP